VKGSGIWVSRIVPSGGAVGCTIVARNYLAYARVLAEGWRRHQAGLPLRVLVLDGDGPGDEHTVPGAAIVSPSELGVPEGELARMRGIYGVAELSTALKPHLISALLEQGAETVVFLDADTDVRADLGDVVELARRHGIVLSPHLLTPPPWDGRSPGELEKGVSGIFNSGFLAVSDGGRAFLGWWASRLRRDCLFCDPLGLHADQRWLDFVPSYFPHHVLRDAGVNVAQWNLHERPLACAGDVYTVAGGPLRTFHFAGFDPDDPVRPSVYEWWGRLRFEAASEPGLLRLCRDYAARLVAAGHGDLRQQPYRYARSAAGRPLGTWERRAYRELVIAAEGRADLPDPFDECRSDEFERILDDPAGTLLLSPAARARLRDLRLLGPFAAGDRWDPMRLAVGLARQLPRRLLGRRIPWRPHPLPSDMTRLEYDGARTIPASAVGESR
jgi:hypothetical protein